MKQFKPILHPDITRQLYEDNYGLVYSLNDTFMRNPVVDQEWGYNKNKVEFVRASLAYDTSGNEYASGVPVYNYANIGYDTKGLIVSGENSNLFSEANSVSFVAAQTINLDGEYTVSVNDGTGKLVLSGGAVADVEVGETHTFTVSPAADVTFTPTSGTPELCQLEEFPHATFWRKGGVTKAGDSPRIFVPENSFSGEFGMGICWRHYSKTDDPAYQRVIKAWKDADNHFRLFLRGNLNFRLQFDYTEAGASYRDHFNLFGSPCTEVPPGTLIGAYIHVVPGEGFFIYGWTGGILQTQGYLNSALPAMPSDLTQVAIGHRLRALTQRSEFVEGIFFNLKLDIPPYHQPEPLKYFEEVGLT